jgi:hypothetical protein
MDMKRLLAFLAILTVVMIIMAIMANTSKASVNPFKRKLTQKKEVRANKPTIIPIMSHTSADYQIAEYIDGNETKPLISRYKNNLSEACSETVEYSSATNIIDEADFETVAY